MIHHVSVGSNDPRAARAFYDVVMPHLGFRLLDATDAAADYGIGDTIFSVETPDDGAPASAGNGAHFAFTARDRTMVDRFYALALANGGSAAGAPGLRPAYV